MKTVRLTMAQALVRWLCAQRTVIDGTEQPLFGGVFAIFGHGNVTCLGEALEAVQDTLPTWRGQNEQSMALAGVAYAKAKKRRQIMVATSSIGPGALNMVTAAGVAHTNRLPILLLSGETFANRVPDPVLQQVEHFSDPTVTVNDAFKAVTRYWDRITRPEQIVGSLPQAVATMLDPADCGPAFIALAQDVQGEAYDYPEKFFEPTVLARAAAAPRRRAAGRGGPGAAQGGAAADRRGRRRALCARDRRARELRPDPSRAGGRDHRRARQPAARPPAQCRPARRDRQRIRQCARRRCRRRARGRHAAAGLHHRLLDRVRQPGRQADRAERRPLRCHQASRARGRGRRPGRPFRAVGSACRLARAGRLERSGIGRVCRLERAGRQGLGPDQHRAADLCPCGRRDQPGLRSDRPGADRGRRPAGRALQELARQDASAPSTASSASPAWATRSPAAGAPGWRTPSAT